MPGEAAPAPPNVDPAALTAGSPTPEAAQKSTPPPDPEEAEKRRLVQVYGATGLTAVLFFASFHPIDWGMLAWVCLVPWLFVALRETKRTAAIMSYATMFLGHLMGLAWIALVTSPGWITTSFLEGFYSLAVCLLVRRLRTRLALPVTVLLPPLWVAGEYSRAAHLAFIKFPWLLLGQTQHDRTNLIQIADLASVYGISFIVVAVNAWIVDALLAWDERRRAGRELDATDVKRLARIGAIPLGLLVAANLYGAIRSRQVEASLVDGPKLLAVQIDVPQNLDTGVPTYSARDIADTNFALTRAALAGLKEKDLPDAIVWTETSWPWPLNIDYPDFTKFDDYVIDRYNRAYPRTPDRPGGGDILRDRTNALFRLVELNKCDVLLGTEDCGRIEDMFTENAILHNSVYQIGPKEDGTVGIKERYDKCNLVPASEGIPGQGTSYEFFYNFVKKFVPKGFVTFEAGKGPRIMTLAREPHWRISPDICFEVSFPELVAEGVRKGAQVLVCPSNDGWFHTKDNLASAEINLAYDHAQLRAIENRRGMVRVVNRGVTCFVDPLGQKVAEVVGTTRNRLGETVTSNLHVEGWILGRVPTTELTSVYVLVGDAFAWLTWIASGLLIALSFRRGR
jgi:apolipoprotein N-acyltransferase